MVKSNYKAWDVQADTFSEDWTDEQKLIFFARYAILAPSGHNTQPWELKLHNDKLLISINKSHHLSIDGSGLLSVEPYISIGTFLEVFNLAALGFGYKAIINTSPSAAIVATISIGGRASARPELLRAIVTRRSNRNAYEETPLSPSELETISRCELPGIKATIVSKRTDIDFVAEQTEIAVESTMSNPLYRKELSDWVRTNHTRKYDGMPGFTHGFGNLQSLVSKTAVRHAPDQGPGARKSKKLAEKSGALIIVRCTDDNKNSFINAGRLYSQICVLANSIGYATSGLGASVLDGSTRELVKKHFDIKDRPVYIIRVGKATSVALHSPRWPLEKILTEE